MHPEGVGEPWAILAILFGLEDHAYAKNVGAPIATSVDSKSATPTQPADSAQLGSKLAKPYYIEFRSRSAESYGHTFSVFGRLNAQGKIVTKEVAGLHPISESPIPWMIGHLVLVPSETGASDGDKEDQYVTARFRVVMNEVEYKKVTAYIKQLQKSSPVWHAVLYNCNAWVGDIARFMGLKTPSSTMLMPAEYISGLRDMNIARHDLDAMLGTPVSVPDASVLRAEALRAASQHENQSAAKLTTAAPKLTTAAPKLTAAAPKQNVAATMSTPSPAQ